MTLDLSWISCTSNNNQKVLQTRKQKIWWRIAEGMNMQRAFQKQHVAKEIVSIGFCLFWILFVDRFFLLYDVQQPFQSVKAPETQHRILKLMLSYMYSSSSPGIVLSSRTSVVSSFNHSQIFWSWLIVH